MQRCHAHRHHGRVGTEDLDQLRRENPQQRCQRHEHAGGEPHAEPVPFFDAREQAGTVVVAAHRLKALAETHDHRIGAQHDAHHDGHAGDGRVAERVGGDVHAGHGNRAGALADQRRQAAASHFAHEQHIRFAIAQGQFHHAEFAAHCGQNREAHRLADGGGEAGTENPQTGHENEQWRKQEIQQRAGHQTNHAERRLTLVSQQSVECERTAHAGCGDQQRRQILHGVWGDRRGRAQHADQWPQGQQSDCGNHQTGDHRARKAHGQ